MATRPHGTLFYYLNDPSGTSLTMTDAEGDTVWQVVYDGYGAVLTGTIPVTLTQTLLDMPDGTTGLVHQGNGRYYDPALGRPLQPNPAGVPPTVPQALNRYAATPMGQPGVFQSQSNSDFPPFLIATGLNAISAGSGMGVSAYANHLVGDLLIQTSGKVLQDAGMNAFFKRVPGIRNHYYISGLVKPLDDTTFEVIESGATISLTNLRSYGKVVFPDGQPFSAIDDNILKQTLRLKGGEFAAGLAINLTLSYFDFAATWQDPYFSTGQKTVQTLVTIGGAAASSGASVAVGGWAAATGLGGPVTFVVLTGTGVIVYVSWEHAVKPIVSWAFTSLGRPDPYLKYRHLQPFSGGE